MLVQRAIECRPGCKECRAAYEASSDPDFQSVGFKGLKIMCGERGKLKAGMHQPELIAALQQCEDFAVKHLADRAYVTEYLAKAGHLCLFGTKYHAELMWIERKWMHLKRFIRGDLDGGLPRLKQLLSKHFKVFKILDSCKAARHCRTTMRAYVVLAENATLDSLQQEEQKMKGHRRVLDSADNILKLKADVTLTEREEKYAQRTEIRRRNDAEEKDDMAEFKGEQAAKRRRKSKLALTTVKKDQLKAASIIRLDKSKKEGPKKQMTIKDMISKTFKQHGINDKE